MKNILKAFMILAAAIAAMSCEKAEAEGEKLNQNLAFTFKADKIEHDSARIVVSHNGSSTDTWYGFLVEGEVKNLGTAILKEIETLNKSDLTGLLETGVRKNINLRKLNPSTTYTYIAVGLSDKGEVYGTYNSVSFTTAREMPDFVETETWSIEYERGIFVDPTNGNEYPNKEIFHVECEEGKYFYFSIVDQEVMNYYDMKVEDYIEYIIEYEVESYINAGYTYADIIITMNNVNIPYSRQMAGNYYAFAIGYDAECNLTGEYSLFDFEIEEEKATPEYNQWLGTWELPFTYTDIDENENEITVEASYRVTFTSADNNFMYLMYGWESEGENLITDLDEFFASALTQLGYNNGFPLIIYYEDGKLLFPETDGLLEFTDQSGEYYSFGFFGIGDLTDKEKGTVTEDRLIGWNGMTMAIGSTENGQDGVIEGTTYEDETMKIEYKSMFMCGYPTNQYSEAPLAYYNPPVQFPITMNKISDETISTMSMTKRTAPSKEDLLKRKSFETKKAGKPIMLAR